MFSRQTDIVLYTEDFVYLSYLSNISTVVMFWYSVIHTVHQWLTSRSSRRLSQ